MESFSRIFLPIYWLTYIALAYALPLVAFRRRYGISAEAVQNPDPVMQIGERWRDIIFTTALLTASAYALHPPMLAHLGALPLLEAPLVRPAGLVLLLLALVLVRLGQLHLGSSWRIGFDPDAPPTALVTTGVYRWSRNPIYVGMAMSALGYFIVLPNAVTLAIACVAIVLIQTRAAVEERWLLAAHGDAYRTYCERTPRWLLSPSPPASVKEGEPPRRAPAVRH